MHAETEEPLFYWDLATVVLWHAKKNSQAFLPRPARTRIKRALTQIEDNCSAVKYFTVKPRCVRTGSGGHPFWGGGNKTLRVSSWMCCHGNRSACPKT